MYSDRDGTATKQSQSAYDSRVRYLRLATSVLVSIGFGAAIADGEYGRAIIQWPADPVWALHWDRLLWVGLTADAALLMSKIDRANAVLL
ncbi:hypothetical protein MY4038_000683 [Beauveria bassiana]